jgi:hypothetical protein
MKLGARLCLLADIRTWLDGIDADLCRITPVPDGDVPAPHPARIPP